MWGWKMIKVTEENVKDITFDGIIVQVPKSQCHIDMELGFVVECSYRTKGRHGYPKSGQNPDDSSFYTIYYNDGYLPNGLQFNSTSRFNLEHTFGHMDLVDYYKFDNMEEFCEWYLNNNNPNNKKGKRRELLRDVMRYVDYNDRINSLRELQTQYRHNEGMVSPECYTYIACQLQNTINDLHNWLDEDI